MKNTPKHVSLALCGLLLLLSGQAAPATDIQGKWKFVFETPLGPRESLMELSRDGEKVTVKGPKTEFKGTFKDGKLELAGQVHSVEGGYAAELTISGRLEGDQIKGDATWSRWTMPFMAEREK